MIMEPVQCRMARAGLRWGGRDLAGKASVSTACVTRFEKGRNVRLDTINSLQSAIETAGINLVPDVGQGPAVRLW